MSYLSIRDLDLNGKRVFIRVDFNVPLQKNEKGDNTRWHTAPVSSWRHTWGGPKGSPMPT